MLALIPNGKIRFETHLLINFDKNLYFNKYDLKGH